MKWLQRLGLLAIGLLVAACTGVGSGGSSNCPVGQTYDQASGACVPAVGQDGGVVTDGAGGDGNGGTTVGDFDSGSSDTGGSGQDPTGKGKPASPNCEKWTDDDGDGHVCNYDNCPETKNAMQKDKDGDGIGDACDNCPATANVKQNDSNGDGQGDACSGQAGYNYDKDHDGDGQPTTRDNCPRTKNPNQTDSDKDKLGDACDNCPNDANYDQTDSNNDGKGDACSTQPVGKECDRLKKTSQIKQTDLYVILDKSGSMSGQKMRQAKDALDKFANVIGGTAMQFGLYAYDTVSCREYLSMGTHSTSQIKNSYAGINPQGSTPTGPAMENVRTQGLFQPRGGGSGSNAVIVITDGNANECSCSGGFGTCDEDQYAIDEAGKFHNQEGTDVYVVGFQFSGDTTVLNQMAQAGGTGQYYQAGNPSSLTKTLLGVALAGCKIDLNKSSKGKIDPAKLWVKVNNQWVKSKHISYDKSSHSVQIDPAVCSSKSGKRTVTVVAGCPTKCDKKSEEICDYKDNDCDGEIDEGCEGCSPEVCDGKDNDCDGNVDEGCCSGASQGEKCQQNSDCCYGHCTSQGVCGEPCRPTQTPCTADSQCCGDQTVCAGSGSGPGICKGG